MLIREINRLERTLLGFYMSKLKRKVIFKDQNSKQLKKTKNLIKKSENLKE
jgi:hypothetical protein